jgi:hypothetical protein
VEIIETITIGVMITVLEFGESHQAALLKYLLIMTLIITMDFTLFLTQQLNYVLSLSENLMAAAIRMLISTTTVSAQILHLLYLQSQLQ